MEKGYLNFFKEFLYLLYSKFNKYNVRENQHCIQRRDMSLDMFFKHLQHDFL